MSKKIPVLFSLLVLLTLVLSSCGGAAAGAYRSAHTSTD